MSRAARQAGLVMLMLALLAAGVITNAFVTGHQIQHRQQQWCAALQILTATPVPKPADPKANPSRVQAYRLYEDFVVIEREFGC